MYRHIHDVDGTDYKIDVWDTAGQDVFDELHDSYYFGAHACALVFDTQRKVTYSNLKKWYKEMREH